MSHRRVKALGYEDDYDDEDEFDEGEEYEGGNGEMNCRKAVELFLLTFQQK
jgi:hypothetical protein